MEVVGDLGQDPGPVDRVDRTQSVGLVERRVRKERLDRVLLPSEPVPNASQSLEGGQLSTRQRRGQGAHLAVVERALDRDAVNVVVEDGRHLCLLDGRHPPGREEHEDLDVGLAADSVDRSPAITQEKGSGGQSPFERT